MNQYQPSDRLSRLEIRRTYFNVGVRRSISLDAQGRGSTAHHHENHSLGGESYTDDDDDGDDNDQRCLSPLPCREGCRDLLTKLMSPLISSIPVDRSVSLSRDEAVRTVLEPLRNELKPASQGTQANCKQTAYAARKSVKELYGRPSWWGDGDSEDVKEEDKPLPRSHSAQSSCKVSFDDLRSTSPLGQATPRRQAEAFTIDLADGGNSSAAGSVCVPERLRRALQERQQLTRKHSVPTERPITAPAINKCPPQRTPQRKLVYRQPTRNAETSVVKASSRPPTTTFSNNTRPPFTSPPTSSPKNVVKKNTAKNSASRATKAPAIQSTSQRKGPVKPPPQGQPNPLTQRNRIPLRQTPSKNPTTPNGVRKPTASRGEFAGASPSLSASPPAVKPLERVHPPGTAVGATVQSNRIPKKPGPAPTGAEVGVKKPVGSPLQLRFPASVRTPGRQSTPTRTAISEEKRIPSMPQNTPRLTKAPAISGPRVAVTNPKVKPSRLLFNSLKKPITTTNTTSVTAASSVGLPTKPMLNGSTICDPVIQEIWSYRDVKDYVMEKMFQGITATYSAVTAAKSTTQSVFDEFKIAAAASAAAATAMAPATSALTTAPTAPVPPTKAKTPAACTPEERKELELFEKVEAEINKFGEDEEEALAQALSPLVEDFSRTWIRGKSATESDSICHPPIEALPVVDETKEENLPTQGMSTAASTVTLENPVTHPEDHGMEPDTLQNAESIQSIAETYVLDANDTLAAEGIPPVVIYDSMEKLLMKTIGETNIMETSNTCTLPYQGTMTSRSGSSNVEEEAEPPQISEEDSSNEFKGEVDSLSDGEDVETKPNGSGGILLGSSRRHEASTIPEYLTKTPCWSEKQDASKKAQPRSRGEKPWTPTFTKPLDTKTSQLNISKDNTSTDIRPYQSVDSGVVDSDPHPGVPPSTATPSATTTANIAFKIPPSNSLISQGRIFSAQDSYDFLNTSVCTSSSSSSSSSSPLIEQFKEEFLQPEIVPKSTGIRTSVQPTKTLEMRNPRNSQRTHSATTRRSWNQENTSLEETWSQLRRHASRYSIQSECGEGGGSPRVGGHAHRYRYPSARYGSRNVKRNSDAVYPLSGQQPSVIRSTHSTASLDTALLLRDSQEALNEIARRIYRQPAHPAVPAAPIQLPQLQSLSTYLAHRYAESTVARSPNPDKPRPPSPSLHQPTSDLHSQSIDRPSISGKATNHHEGNQSTRLLSTSNQNQALIETRQSISTVPYSPPVSAPPISPVSIASATEPGHPFRSGRRPANSARYVVRRHSLRNANHQRVDSPTPNDLFPAEHSTAPNIHPPASHLPTKVVTEVKVVPSRPTGISVTTTVPPMVLQRRPEPATKHCSVVAITPILRGNQPSGGQTTETSVGGVTTSMKTPSTEEAMGSLVGGIAKPIPRRFDADEVLRGSAFSAVASTRVALRPNEIGAADAVERSRRSLSLGPVCAGDTVDTRGDDMKPLPDPSDKSYETLLAASILRLSNRLLRCSDNLAQRIGAPSSDATSPVTSGNWKSGLKPSTSLHQELNDSLSNMRTVEQQLQYMENVLFGRGVRGGTYERRKSSTETDYLHELERINNELRGFVPIGAGGGGGGGERDRGTAASLVSTEATDSGVDASMLVERGSDGIDPSTKRTSSRCAARSVEEPAFLNEDIY